MQAWHLWAMAAIVLGLMELMGAHFVLLGLGLAAAVVAIYVGLAPEAGLGGQILMFAVAAAIIVPAIILVYRRYYPAGGVSVMNEPGDAAAEPRVVIEREGRAGVEVYGDFFPVRFATSGLVPEAGRQVRIVGFQGITALVRSASESGTEFESKGD